MPKTEGTYEYKFSSSRLVYSHILYPFVLTCGAVVERLHELDFRTCMGWGPNYYRTFDGYEYYFPGRCEYVLFDDGYRTVTETMIDCQSYKTCRKVVLFSELKLLTKYQRFSNEVLCLTLPNPSSHTL